MQHMRTEKQETGGNFLVFMFKCFKCNVMWVYVEVRQTEMCPLSHHLQPLWRWWLMMVINRNKNTRYIVQLDVLWVYRRLLSLTISTPWGKAVPSQSFLGNRWMIFPHPSPEPADKNKDLSVKAESWHVEFCMSS